MSSQPQSQPPAEAPSRQSRLGQYTLLEKIAQGGMAQVFKAKTVDPTGIERLVVIKRILPHIFSQPEYVEMLIDEAKIAVHFTHGNIAQIYDLGRAGEDYFIVMEYVDGRTLSQIYKALQERHRKMPFDVLLYCFIELCHGLSYIHRKTGPTGKPLGVVHRDVSPQNIILSYGGNVKIIDFGVAKADFLESRTEHGVLKGKFAYMSPEQTRGEKIDHRSDLFSVGILLWEMVTGERLFKRGTNQETIKAVQKAKFDPAQSRRGDVPKGLERIIKKALSRAPKARYQDAGDMAVELEKLLFAINPDFRPLLAAQFLYDLFGPEKDEADLPPPYFVGALPPGGKPSRRPAEPSAGPDDDAPTVREDIRNEDTPVVRIPLHKRFPGWNALLVVAAVLIFVIGSSYAFFVHRMNKRAYLSFTGVESGMTLFINGEESGFPEGEMTVASRGEYQIRIAREGYNDYIQQVTLGPRERAEILIEMEKSIPPFGDLTVATDPPGAAVFLDGQEQSGKTPLTLKNLAHGRSYLLKVSAPDRVDSEKRIEIEGGKEIRVDLPLALDYATLVLTSDPPGAEVSWQGGEAGVTPYKITQIVPGEDVNVSLRAPGFIGRDVTLALKAGEEKEMHVVLQPAEADAVSPETRVP